MKRATALTAAILLIFMLGLAMRANGAKPKHQNRLQEIHVCVDQTDGSKDHTVFMSDEPLTPIPSTRMMKWIQSAIHGLGQQRNNPDMLAASNFIRYHLEPVRIPYPPTGGTWDYPPRIVQPPPADPPPVTGYDCQCATAMYSSGKQFVGCMVGGCDGCMICKAN